MMVRPSPVEAYVAVGSNLEPEKHIKQALARLLQSVRVTAVSTFYRTEHVPSQAESAPGPRATGAGQPVAGPSRPRNQPAYLNGVWRVETDKSARVLKFEVLRRIEAELGRTRSADKYAPRTIDLDLVLYGDNAINEEGMRIPDSEIRCRPFLAVPLLEIASSLRLPDSGEDLSSLSVAHMTNDLEPLPEFTEDLRGLISR